MPTIKWPIYVVTVLAFLFALFVCGCDPAGIRRVELQLHPSIVGNNTNTISVEAPNVQEALAVLDKVVMAHGLHLTNDQPGYIRVYCREGPPETYNGHTRVFSFFCRVRLIPSGIEVTFGNFGLLVAEPPIAQELFIDVRSTFIKKYGKKNVKSHELGAPDSMRRQLQSNGT